MGLRALPGGSVGRSGLPGSCRRLVDGAFRMIRRGLEKLETGESRAGSPPSAGRKSFQSAFSGSFSLGADHGRANPARKPATAATFMPCGIFRSESLGWSSALAGYSRAERPGTGGAVENDGGNPGPEPAQRPDRSLRLRPVGEVAVDLRLGQFIRNRAQQPPPYRGCRRGRRRSPRCAVRGPLAADR